MGATRWWRRAIWRRPAGRFEASFVSLPAGRKRFDFDDEALSMIADWIVRTNVRWGIDGQHRAAWGLPSEFTANSWRVA